MLYQPCWDNIAQEYCLVKVAQIRPRQHCTRKLLAQCSPRAHRYTFAEKTASSNMPGGLLFKLKYSKVFMKTLQLKRSKRMIFERQGLL